MTRVGVRRNQPRGPAGTVCTLGLSHQASNTGSMRLTEFWRRMDEVFGPHAQFLATDRVFAELGNRTVTQALADGEPVKDVWRGLCEGADVAPSER